MKNGPTGRRLAAALKALLVLGLLLFLFQKHAISLERTAAAFTRWEHIVPALLAVGLITFLVSLRWQWLLRAQGIRLPLTKTIELSLIGAFFSLALLGAVTGDVVKVYYLGRATSVRRARAFGSILLDRIVGASALALVAAAGFWLAPAAIRKGLLAIQCLAMSAAAGVAAFYAYLFLVSDHHDPLLEVMKRLHKNWARTEPMLRIYEGIRCYHERRWIVTQALLLSVAMQLIAGWVFLQFAQALGDGVPLLGLYMVVPFALLVTAIPVRPAASGPGMPRSCTS